MKRGFLKTTTITKLITTYNNTDRKWVRILCAMLLKSNLLYHKDKKEFYIKAVSILFTIVFYFVIIKFFKWVVWDVVISYLWNLIF